MKKIIIGIGILLIIIGITAVLFLSSLSYNGFLDLVINVIDVPETKRDKLTKFMTDLTFRIIQGFPLILALFGVLLILCTSLIHDTFKEVGDWGKRITQFFTTLPTFEKCLLLFIVVGYALYSISNAIRLPVHYDEAFTYYNFTKRSFFSSISYYPVPNNHIFHSVLTNLTFHLPFSELINLRIPNLIVSFFVTICLFYTFSKLLRQRIILLLLPLFCLLFPIIWYSSHSRGYMLVLLTFIVCFYATLRLTHLREENQSDKAYYLYFTIASIFGFYTIPSYLYPFLTCASYIFGYLIINKSYSKILRFSLYCAVTTTVVVLLYTPIFVVSGVEAVAGNRFVEPISRMVILKQLIPHFEKTSHFLFGVPMIITLVFLFIATIVLLRKKKYSILFSLYCFLIMPVMLMIHGVRPFPRTWVYIIIPFIYVLGLLIKTFELDKKMSNWSIIITQIIATCLLIFSFNSRLAQSRDFSQDAWEMADYLIKNNAKHVYSNHQLVSTNLLFLFEERNAAIDIMYAPRLLDSMELITIKSCCDYVISGNHPLPEHGFTFIKDWQGYIYLSRSE